MNYEDIPFLTIAETSTLIKRKKLSPVELVKALLTRIDRVEPKVHAFITLMGEAALVAAKSAEREIARGKYRGPLHGIPVGVKDTHYFKIFFNLTGLPALAIPCGFSTSRPGLPLGLQIVARPFEDELTYAVGHAYESVTDWHKRRPPI
ncbi:MAG: amidase family protein [Candidatus Binatia bacterium]